MKLKSAEWYRIAQHFDTDTGVGKGIWAAERNISYIRVEDILSSEVKYEDVIKVWICEYLYSSQ